MKRKSAKAFLVVLLLGSASVAHAEVEEVWEGHEIDAGFTTAMAFPTNLSRTVFTYDTVTYHFGFDADVRVWWHLYAGLSLGYSGFEGKARVGTGKLDVHTLSLPAHVRLKYPLPWLQDRLRVGGNIGMGPYITITSSNTAGVSGETNADFGVNFGLQGEYLLSDWFTVGPAYRMHIIANDDTYLLHTLGAEMHVRF